MLACGRPGEAILFRALPEGDWWGTLVEDGVPSLPGLIIQLGKIREAFRSRWNNLIGITHGFGGPVNGP